MSKRSLCVLAGSCGVMLFALCAVPSGAQSSEVKEKPPLYSYIANWQIPRSHWADLTKANAADNAILEKALADGTIVGFGSDENLVHQPDSPTHDSWWQAMSLAGLIKVLDQFYASGNTTSDVYASATRHEDAVFVSRYYNWHSGAYKNGYTHVGAYKLKADAPDDAIDSLSKNLVVPLMEKLIADGTIVEYEVDTMAIHTEAPGAFWISYITPKPEGLDKVQGAILDAAKAQPLFGPAFGSMTDSKGHRDELIRGDGKYK
jgi:hypothetical protein